MANVLRGGGKANREAVVGLKELEKKLRGMMPDNPEMAQWLQEIVAGGAKAMRDEMIQQARSAGWASQTIRSQGKTIRGSEAIGSIFSYGKPKESRRTKVSALAGVTKRDTMIEWRASRHPKSSRAKVAFPNRVAMAFATMLEFGTTRMRARPAIRTAVKTARPRIISAITDGFNQVYQRFAA